MKNTYVQYGCGLSAPETWINFDSSPTLRIQKTPVIGRILSAKLNTHFPPNVKYGDIVKGLPVADNTCDGVYCSHVLEHLSLEDFRVALQNTIRIMKPGGVFRCVVPDLEVLAARYLENLKTSPATASINFIGNGTLLGTVRRPRGLKAMVVNSLGNSHHLWMWDHHSLTAELEKVGFTNVRKAAFGDSKVIAFEAVEDQSRFESAVALECHK